MNTLIASAKTTGGWELTPQTMWIPIAIVAGPPLVLTIWFFWSDKRLRDRRKRRSS